MRNTHSVAVQANKAQFFTYGNLDTTQQQVWHILDQTSLRNQTSCGALQQFVKFNLSQKKALIPEMASVVSFTWLTRWFLSCSVKNE